MPRDKIKPPAETKAQLMEDVKDILMQHYIKENAILFLLNFFTAADLVGIRDELRK